MRLQAFNKVKSFNNTANYTVLKVLIRGNKLENIYINFTMKCYFLHGLSTLWKYKTHEV